MKQNKRIFNKLLIRYNKYLRKRESLALAGRNQRRQSILTKHIERLFEKLMSLKLVIEKRTIAASLIVGALAFAPQVADAQNFGAPQTNPFGLTQVDYSNSKPIFVDLDGDGDLDVMSGEDYDYGNFNYYENTGTNTAPAFAPFQTNPFGITAMGYSEGTPTFVDIDGDGDLDMMVGFGYDYDYYTSSYSYGGFVYYQNTGTATAPAFAAPVINPFGITEVGGYGYSAPTFADIDNDGDMDMISGFGGYYNSSTYSYIYGGFKYYENTGTNLAPAFAAPVTNPFGLTEVGYYNSTPSLVDIDGDGDFDLISGAYYVGSASYDNIGGFAYFENTGTNLAPAFAAMAINPFGLTDPGTPAEYTAPTVADLNNDGDLDLLTGIRNGDLIYYPGCSPSTATISPTAVCSYTSPSGNVWSASNTYMDTIPNASGCDSVITINLTVNPMTDQTLTAGTVCGTGSTTIDLASSQTGVNYYLRDNTNDTIVDGPLTGTGSGITLNTDTISAPATYNVYAEKLVNTRALTFDDGSGIPAKVNCGNSPSVQLSGTQITLEAWIFPTSWAGPVWAESIINKESSGPDNGYMLRCGNNGQLSFNLGDGTWNELLTPTGTLVLNQWQHVAASYEGTTMSIFVDGILVASQPMSINFLSPSSNLAIGNWDLDFGSRPFRGKIDEAKIWSVSKTQAQIQANMNTCLAGTETGLAAYYQFEDGAGSSTLTDLTANANDGTLQNMNVNTVWSTGSTVCSSCSMEMTQIITVNVGQTNTSTISPTACGSYTSPSGDSTWTMSGTYMDTIPNVSGCDSVMTINLTVNSVDTSTSTSGFVITSNEASTGTTYRWLDCNNNNAVIVGQTNANYTVTANGDYAVEVTVNGCTDTSACVNVVVTSIVGFNQSNVAIYPNPMNNQFTIELGSQTNNTQINIISIEGKTVYNNTLLNNNKVIIDASTWNKGVYFVQLQSNSSSKTFKLIKQ